MKYGIKKIKAQVSNPLAAICNNDDYNRSTRLLAATTLRNVLGTKVTKTNTNTKKKTTLRNVPGTKVTTP